MQITKTREINLCALFAALTAVLSQIVIPIGPVPINLATFAVFCAGALLGAKLATLSLMIWAALGIVGVPVFAMFRSGLDALAGPTGGFIAGYIPAAFVIGYLVEKIKKESLYPFAMLIGMLTYFSLGTAWFMYSTNVSFSVALMTCVLPFLPGDIFKIAAATVLVRRTKRLNLTLLMCR